MPAIDTAVLPTATDVAAFARDGYWAGPRILDDAELDACRAAMDAVYAGGTETGVAPYSASWKPGDEPAALRKTDNAWWANRTLAALATHQLIGACAAALMGADGIRLWQDQLLYKPGGGFDSTVVGWHQDWNYWRGAADAPLLVTAWVAFDDVDERNGVMQVIPGSHQWGLLEETNNFFAHDSAAQMAALRAHEGFREPVSLNLRAGHASFHHCLTFHGSAPNLTTAPRRALAVHLMVDGLRCAKEPNPVGLHYNTALFTERGGRIGEPYSGELWPVVYSAR